MWLVPLTVIECDRGGICIAGGSLVSESGTGTAPINKQYIERLIIRAESQIGKSASMAKKIEWIGRNNPTMAPLEQWQEATEKALLLYENQMKTGE